MPLDTRALGVVEAWLLAGAARTPDGVVFNMLATGKRDDEFSWDSAECGTACCVGGALHKLSGVGSPPNDEVSDRSFLEEVADEVGMTPDQTRNLFWGHNRPGGLFDISPLEAAGAIRSMIETGHVIWGGYPEKIREEEEKW